MTDLQKTLETLDELDKSRTAGPWEMRDDGGDYIVGSPSDSYMMCDTSYYPTALPTNDARFIVALENAWPQIRAALAHQQRAESA